MNCNVVQWQDTCYIAHVCSLLLRQGSKQFNSQSALCYFFSILCVTYLLCTYLSYLIFLLYLTFLLYLISYYVLLFATPKAQLTTRLTDHLVEAYGQDGDQLLDLGKDLYLAKLRNQKNDVDCGIDKMNRNENIICIYIYILKTEGKRNEKEMRKRTCHRET